MGNILSDFIISSKFKTQMTSKADHDDFHVPQPSTSRQQEQYRHTTFEQLPKLSTSFQYSTSHTGNIEKMVILLYDPLQISFATNFQTLFAEVIPRQFIKNTINAALGHIACIIYVFRYRRAIRTDLVTKSTLVVNAEMNIHKTPDNISQHVEEVSQYYMNQYYKRHGSQPTISTLFSMCIHYKKKDFLSADGTLIILQSTTLQLLIEISRCVERLTGQSFSSMFFPVGETEEKVNDKKKKLNAMHLELDFIQSPTTFSDDL
jgi:hypothetical protein